MTSVFERLWRVGPAAIVLKAIVAAIIADAMLLAVILLRRGYRSWHFRRRDARVFHWRQRWNALISGQVSYDSWRNKSLDRSIIESMALDAFETAGPAESARLLSFLRISGLIEKRIFEARRTTGWRRMRALVALGRTRAPEGIHALAEALRDRSLEIRLAALRGLGRTASPNAAEEILQWVGECGLAVPALPLQSALVHCCAEHPQILVPYVQNASGPLREALGRVLGEVATPSLDLDLLQFVGDDLDELRAAAARAFCHGESGVAFDVLSELARDPTWFVRLRAIVSLGKIADPRAVSALLRGLTDSNRLVRLRAAEALIELRIEMAPLFKKVADTQDRYGIYAYLTAIDNANLREKLSADIDGSASLDDETRARLRRVLQSGALHADEAVPAGAAGDHAASHR
ncbi:MAG: HEAT repeat domain-containing protein [Acidobacteriota bacterium]|nr:HEAT repeat domain-containing protein [Acidobacteriota bacterium]